MFWGDALQWRNDKTYANRTAGIFVEKLIQSEEAVA